MPNSTLLYFRNLLLEFYNMPIEKRNKFFKNGYSELIKFFKKIRLYQVYFELILSNEQANKFLEEKFAEMDKKYGQTPNNFQSFYARFEILNFLTDMYWETYQNQLYQVTTKYYFKRFFDIFDPKSDHILILRNYLRYIPYPDNLIFLESLKQIYGDFKLNLPDFISTKDYLILKSKKITDYIYNSANFLIKYGEKFGFSKFVIHGAYKFFEIYLDNMNLQASGIYQFVKHGISYFNRVKNLYLPIQKYNEYKAQNYSDIQIFFAFMGEYSVSKIAEFSYGKKTGANLQISNSITYTPQTVKDIKKVNLIKKTEKKSNSRYQTIHLEHSKHLYLPYWFYKLEISK